jgi:hypothetical protein
MAMTSRIKTIGRVGGVAATTAPYVRRLATDEELRDDVSDFARAANNLMTHIRTDRTLRQDVYRMIGSMQRGADHLRSDVRPRHHYLRTMFIGAGLIVVGMAAAITLGWPRARQGVTRVASQTTSRANSTVHDIRERISRQNEQAA